LHEEKTRNPGSLAKFIFKRTRLDGKLNITSTSSEKFLYK
jgi:hypothetical protein